MEEKREMKEIFKKLTKENREVVLMIAKGMELAQSNTVSKINN